MDAMRATLSVGGTLLSREDESPLWAMEVMQGDRLVQAQVVDLQLLSREVEPAREAS